MENVSHQILHEKSHHKQPRKEAIAGISDAKKYITDVELSNPILNRDPVHFKQGFKTISLGQWSLLSGFAQHAPGMRPNPLHPDTNSQWLGMY